MDVKLVPLKHPFEDPLMYPSVNTPLKYHVLNVILSVILSIILSIILSVILNLNNILNVFLHAKINRTWLEVIHSRHFQTKRSNTCCNRVAILRNYTHFSMKDKRIHKIAKLHE